jgi:predicted RND superfamily exporter protein
MDSEAFVVSYVRWVIRWRWGVVLATAVAVAAAGSGVRFLEFSNDYRIFFSDQNPQLQAFNALERIYSKKDNIQFVITPGGDVVRPEVLSVIKELTDASWQIPFSLRVDSITNFQHTRAEGDDLTVADLVPDPSALREGQLDEIRAVLRSEPLLRTRMVSDDHTTTGVNVTLQVPGKSIQEIPAAATYARRLASELRERHPEYHVAITGSAMLSLAFAEAPQADFGFLIPVMYGVLVMAMLLFLRSLSAALATVTLVALSAATAMGCAGWLAYKLNGVSACAPTIILTLAIADSVHILVTMFDQMRRGVSRNDALVESLRVNAQPVFLTSLTTVIGFLSLNFSDAPPLRDLGNLTAIGVAAAWLFSVSFLPALLSMLPLRARRYDASGGPAMERLADFVVRRRRPLFYGMSGIVVALAASIPLFEINDRPVEYFDDSIEFRRDTEYARKHLVGIYSFSLSLGAGESSGINEPEYLERLEAFTEWLRAREPVVHVVTLSDTMKRLNKNMHGDDPAWYRLPTERDLAAQYLLLYVASLRPRPQRPDQRGQERHACRRHVRSARRGDRLQDREADQGRIRAVAPGPWTAVDGGGACEHGRHVRLHRRAQHLRHGPWHGTRLRAHLDRADGGPPEPQAGPLEHHPEFRSDDHGLRHLGPGLG